MGRPRKDETEIMVATDSGTIDYEGVPYQITKGVTRMRANHPLVKAAEHLFKPIDTHYPEIEQATAAPGEHRGD